MYARKLIVIGLLFTLTLLFTACQGTNSDTQGSGSGTSSTDTNTSSPDTNVTIPDINTTVPDVPDTNVTTNIDEILTVFPSSASTIINFQTAEQYLIVNEGSSLSVNIDVIASSTTDGESAIGTVKFLYPQVNGSTVTYLGVLSPLEGVDVSEGKASFTYNPPSNIAQLREQGINGARFLFYVNNQVTREFNVLFENPIYSGYDFTLYPETAIEITRASQSQVLDIYLENTTTNLPVAGERVIVENFDTTTKGSLNSFS